MMMDPHAAAYDYGTLLGLVVASVLTLGTFFFLSVMVRTHLGIGRENALAFSAVVTAAGLGAGVYHAVKIGAPNPTQAIVGQVAAVFFAVVGVPLAVKIYRAWMGVQVTKEERMPGAAGLRAWLSPFKLIAAALFAGSAYFAYHIPISEGLGVTIMLLLAYPMGNSLGADAQSTAPGANLGPERERVLSMLEAGRITAEESAELLSALAATVPVAEPARRFSPSERRALVAAAVVLAGFFLPWYQVNPGQELQRTMSMLPGGGEFIRADGSVEPSDALASQNGMLGMPTTPTISITGGDISHGLGWVVIFCALGAAILPFFGGAMEPEMRRLLMVLALCVGTIILLYLIFSGLRYVRSGLALAAIGYVFEITALALPANPRGRLPESVPVRS